MSNHVFVSHSHEDSSAANLLVSALEERGVVCWLAPRDVAAGGSYAESILNAIESASCFVLIYSQNSNVSSHVMREVERALKFGVNIIPVRFDDSTPSKSLDYLLATVHWLSIAPDARDRSIVRAAEQILAVVAQSQSKGPTREPRVPPVRATAAPVKPAPKKHLLGIAAGVALIVVAGLIGFVVSRNRPPASNAPQNKVAASVSSSATPQLDKSELPLNVINRYFAFLNERKATAAYNLLSANFRSHLNIAKYSKNVGITPRAKLVQAIPVSKDEHSASVTAVFDDPNPETHQPQWRGSIELVRETSGWRIDSMKGLIPASGRSLSASASGSDEDATQNASQSPSESDAATAATPAATLPPSPPREAKMFGIVQDPEGTTKVRAEPHLGAKIIAEIKNGDRVEIDRIQTGWAHVILGPNRSGYIHKARLKISTEKQ
jgi:TIR domain